MKLPNKSFPLPGISHFRRRNRFRSISEHFFRTFGQSSGRWGTRRTFPTSGRAEPGTRSRTGRSRCRTAKEKNEVVKIEQKWPVEKIEDKWPWCWASQKAALRTFYWVTLQFTSRQRGLGCMYCHYLVTEQRTRIRYLNWVTLGLKRHRIRTKIVKL